MKPSKPTAPVETGRGPLTQHSFAITGLRFSDRVLTEHSSRIWKIVLGPAGAAMTGILAKTHITSTLCRRLCELITAIMGVYQLSSEQILPSSISNDCERVWSIAIQYLNSQYRWRTYAVAGKDMEAVIDTFAAARRAYLEHPDLTPKKHLEVLGLLDKWIEFRDASELFVFSFTPRIPSSSPILVETVQQPPYQGDLILQFHEHMMEIQDQMQDQVEEHKQETKRQKILAGYRESDLRHQLSKADEMRSKKIVDMKHLRGEMQKFWSSMTPLLSNMSPDQKASVECN